MKTINARNVQQALPQGLALLRDLALPRDSRAGAVLEVPVPVTTTYRNPCERVLFYPARRANPFFHLMESLWILAGRNDVAWLAQFNKRMAEYSDDGETLHGAYGYRLRHAMAFDQLTRAIHLLQSNHDDRRVVLQIWDAVMDLGSSTKDTPCNDLIMLKVRDGALHMTVCNRSNDAIWGCYGANAVHFSVLQEYIAGMVGVEVGPYNQVSDSLHVYTDNPQWGKLQSVVELADGYHAKPQLEAADPYATNVVRAYPLVTVPEEFDRELELFMEGEWPDVWYNEFFEHTACPMYLSWFNRDTAQVILDTSMPVDSDWKMAAEGWLS